MLNLFVIRLINIYNSHVQQYIDKKLMRKNLFEFYIIYVKMTQIYLFPAETPTVGVPDTGERVVSLRRLCNV